MSYSSTTCAAFEFCFTDCWDKELPQSPTGNCFQVASWSIALGLLLIGFAEVRTVNPIHKLLAYCLSRIPKPKNVQDRDEENVKKICDDEEATVSSDDSDDDSNVHTLSDDSFITTHRTVSNFIKNSSDPNLYMPNNCGPEYTNMSIDHSVYPISGFFRPSISPLHNRGLFRSCWMGSLGWALVCSSVSTVLWNIMFYEATCFPDDTYFRDWVESIAASFNLIQSDYGFYPIFLLVGYITFVANRWREFMVNCHTIQAAVHNIALLCGGAMLKPPPIEVRTRLYTIYRYLNLIHALCYKSVSPTVGPLELETDFVHKLNLLTEDELVLLLPMQNKIRDTVIGWLTNEISLLLTMDGVNAQFVGQQLAGKIGDIRGATAKHHDQFVRDNPNLYLNLMLLIVNILIALTIVGHPFSLLIAVPGFFPFLPCVQWLTLFGVFLLLLSFRTAFTLLVRLRNPFTWSPDCIRVDNLMASTDRTIFATLRSAFHDAGAERSAFHDAGAEGRPTPRQYTLLKAKSPHFRVSQQEPSSPRQRRSSSALIQQIDRNASCNFV